jgi:hypothetical protein
MNVINTRSALVVAVVALAGFAPPAFAYLDPSTGSMILSAILGLLATVGLALKTYWYKFKSLFRGKPSQQPAEAEPHESTADSGRSSGH